MSRVRKHKRTTKKLYKGIALQEIEPGKFNYWFVFGNIYRILTGVKYFTGSFPENNDDPKLKVSSKLIKNTNKNILLAKRNGLSIGCWSYSKVYTINNGRILFDQEDSSYTRKIILYKQL